ncbi:MAG TPA: hypothetical protein DHV51_02075, partial [Opitutae bacterium]|nr:hypothetical protein [Opitutae bacterium]
EQFCKDYDRGTLISSKEGNDSFTTLYQAAQHLRVDPYSLSTWFHQGIDAVPSLFVFDLFDPVNTGNIPQQRITGHYKLTLNDDGTVKLQLPYAYFINDKDHKLIGNFVGIAEYTLSRANEGDPETLKKEGLEVVAKLENIRYQYFPEAKE